MTVGIDLSKANLWLPYLLLGISHARLATHGLIQVRANNGKTRTSDRCSLQGELRR